LTHPLAEAPTRSLGRQLVLATLAFGIVFTLAAVAVRTWWAWEKNLLTMTAELSLIDKVFQRTLSKAIWEMDLDELRTHLGSLAQVSPVSRVELRIRRPGSAPEIIERHQDGVRDQDDSLAPSLHRELVYEPFPGTREAVGEPAADELHVAVVGLGEPCREGAQPRRLFGHPLPQLA